VGLVDLLCTKISLYHEIEAHILLFEGNGQARARVLAKVRDGFGAEFATTMTTTLHSEVSHFISLSQMRREAKGKDLRRTKLRKNERYFGSLRQGQKLVFLFTNHSAGTRSMLA
jgi:hypothetical protein